MEAMQRQNSLRRQQEEERKQKESGAMSTSEATAQAPPPSSTTPFQYPSLTTSWQLPGRDKHAGPSKVRMYDPSIAQSPARPPSFRPLQQQQQSQQSQQQQTQASPSKYQPVFGVPTMPRPSVLVPGAKISTRPPLAPVSTPQQAQQQQQQRYNPLSYVDVSRDDAWSPSKKPATTTTTPSSSSSPMKQTTRAEKREDKEALLDIDNLAQAMPDMPGANNGFTPLTASERDRQLQDMLDAMVIVPDAADEEDDLAGDKKKERSAKVDGLACTLMPHQITGLSWMQQREAGKYKAGILADDMGLGKTVQMLALIVANSPKRNDATIRYVRQTDDRDAYRGAAPKKDPKSKPKDNNSEEDDQKRQKLTLRSHTTLILAPLAVIRQWEREAREKVKEPKLKVLVHHGPGRAKDASAFANYDVVISTYTTASSEWSNLVGSKEEEEGGNLSDSESDQEAASDSDSGDDSRVEAQKKKKKQAALKRNKSKKSAAPLFDAYWLRIVLDEAQNIKNHKTKAAQACVSLGLRAHARWCLSGTPIQNDALELFSLIQFLGIPPFDAYDLFKEKISDPLKSTNQNRVNWGMKRLCIVLQTIMLRRTKDATTDEGKPLLQLPKRTIEVVQRDFDDEEERNFYRDLEQRAREKLEKAQQGSTTGKVNHMVTLLMLLRLRQACSHPALTMREVDAEEVRAPVSSDDSKDGENHGGDESKDEEAATGDDDDGGLADLLSGLSVAGKNRGLTPEEAAELPTEGANLGWRSPGRASTKMRMMLSLLETCPRSEKVIIFSQFTTFLDLAEPFLRQAGHNHVRYDGKMRPVERERSLARIRDEPETRIILVSFKAGSTGLNLTCCSRVILMDLWWNPQIEEQAFDRAHRLGQKNDVVIYKLSITNSVEERILALQEKKRALSKAALEGSKFSKKSGANKLDHKELLYLFSGNVAF